MGVFRADRPEIDPELPLEYRRARPLPYNTPRALQGSARRLTGKEMAAAPRRAAYSAWQTTAWGHFDSIGEIHYGLSLVASVLSRIRVYAGSVIESGEAPVDVDRAAAEGHVPRMVARRAQELLTELTSAGFPSKVRNFSLNMSVPGEVYLVRLPGEPDADGNPGEAEWAFRSTDEVTVGPDGGILYRPMRSAAAGGGGTTGTRTLPPETFIARIWQQHPRYTGEPDSSMPGIADPADELLMLSRVIRSAMRSRMNAGILFIPDGLSVAGSAPAESVDPTTGLPLTDPPAVEVDPGGQFLAELMDAMVKPISDETNAASVVPMLVTGPAELGQQIRHITFERSIDQWLSERADRALERVLQGLDVPKDIVTGLANVKYSNAIVIDEGLYKAHIEPLSVLLSDALTEVYLRPLLIAEDFSQDDVNRVVVWYDPSEIVTRPNSAQDANDGFDRYVLGPPAWRREHGFPDTDAPTEAELAFMLLTKSPLPPEAVSALLNSALPTIVGEERDANIAAKPVPMPQSALSLLQPGRSAEQVGDAATGQPA